MKKSELLELLVNEVEDWELLDLIQYAKDVRFESLKGLSMRKLTELAGLPLVVKTKRKFGKDTRIGIHLLNPDKHELERWIEDAASKGFTRIYVHTNTVHKVQNHKVSV